ncbi:MAG: TM1812 family CRISPR-associated protein [Clostridia bacterium]|nr:TM1812 family CRISPR-associated protein [Clostridia bacterium]
MAVIISFLSDYKKDAKEQEYVLPDPVNEKYRGVHTNQAPLKYLTECAKNLKENETIKYLLIVSEKVYNNKVHNDTFTSADNPTKSQYDYYEYFCKKLSKELSKECEVFPIPYDFKGNVQENSEPLESKVIANNIYQKINEQINDNEKVYIDYTGGFRDISYLLVTLIQYLEIKNVTCESIVYSQLSYNEEPNKIRRIKFIYKINTIIQGAHDFIATGDITKLKEFFNDEKKYPTINNLISKLDDFVKAVSIGQISELEDIKNKINADINKFEPKVTSDDEADLYRNIFTLLFPKIKESLYIEDNAKNEFGYIEIVRWCIAHRFIQQAFTIYVEKFPEIYLKHGINGLIDDSEVKPTMGASHEYTKFYTNFWDSLLDKSEEAQFGKRFIDEFKGDAQYFVWSNVPHSDFTKKFKKQEEKDAIKNLREALFSYKQDCNAVFYGFKKEAGDAKGFFNTMCNSSPEKLGYYLLGRGAEYETSKQNSNSQDASESYKKKKAVIDRLDRLDSNKYEDLISVMQAYLCVKIIRNNMNHAAATDTEKDETLLLHEVSKEFLKDSEIALSDVFSYDVAKSIIDNGVEITEKIVKENKTLLTKKQYEELTGA